MRIIHPMLYGIPRTDRGLDDALAELDSMRRRLGEEVSTFSPWLGSLRRSVRKKSVESSISIEGFEVPRDDMGRLPEAESPDNDENRAAFACYARAMDHVGVMATDPEFAWSERAILDLHFDACYFQKDKSPGQWRAGPILVTEGGGAVAYTGPAAAEVPLLMRDVTTWLEQGDRDAHPVVRGAMAHLHVVSAHPFRDGNGRISRIVQSLVLAQERRISPEFGSIEEYLAEHTSEYYSTLREVQAGSYQPERDATPWVRFCVAAHLEQAGRRLQELDRAAARWDVLERLAEERGWPDRLVIALEQSLTGGTESSGYRAQAEVSAPTASADFRRLMDAGLTELRGKGRNTRYVASGRLRELAGGQAPSNRDPNQERLPARRSRGAAHGRGLG